MPYFSVITPSFNQGAYIDTCIRSVLDQQDADFEHIVIDNCSTDETAAILARYPHLKTTVEPDRGQSDAINKGFRQATGEIICWLNADDAYPPGVFRRLREFFSDPKSTVVFGDAEQVSYETDETIVAPGRFDSRLDLIRWWSSEVKLHQPAMFFRRRLIDEVGLIDESLHYALDYEFWWRMSENHTFHYLPEVLAIQHRQLESKTIVAWDKVLAERERIFGKFYPLLTTYTPAQLEQERRQSLGRHYLRTAFLTASSAPGRAFKLLWRAVRENPREALHWNSLGVFTRMLRK